KEGIYMKRKENQHKFNVLLITTDEQRFDTLGCNGNKYIKTPNLDRLAKEGINFINHTCSSPICTPSRVSILTGMYSRTHGAWHVGYKLDKKSKGIAKWLSKKGYTCGIFGKAHFEAELSNYAENLDHNKRYYGFTDFHITEDNLVGEYLDWIKDEYPEYYQAALKNGNEQTSSPYRDYSPLFHAKGYFKAVFTSELPENLHQTAWITEKTINFIEKKADQQQPFFAWCSYVDPHHPFNPPEPCASMYNPSNLPIPIRKEGEDVGIPALYFRGKDIPDSEYQRMCAAYYGMISHIDHHIGRILKVLEEKNQLENTIIIFTSDHGDYNGDHGLVRKGIFMFDNILKVPFLIRLPNQAQAGTTFTGATQHEDIIPTLFDYLGVSIPKEVQGESFISVLNKGIKGKSRKYSYFEYQNHAVGISKGSWKLIYYPQKSWPFADKLQKENTKDSFQIISLPKLGNGFVLTNIEDDPMEYDNLIGKKEYVEIKNELKQALFNWLLNTPLYYPNRPYLW
ncbi:MAG: sulfatase, partial [Candidatus Hodarchaeota archaeon]